MQVLFAAAAIVLVPVHWLLAGKSCILMEQGQTSSFSTKYNVLLTPLPFQFFCPLQFFIPFSTILLFSLLNVFIPSSTIFIIFPLQFFYSPPPPPPSPPPPHFYCFLSTTTTATFLLFSLHHHHNHHHMSNVFPRPPLPLVVPPWGLVCRGRRVTKRVFKGRVSWWKCTRLFGVVLFWLGFWKTNCRLASVAVAWLLG